MYLRDSIFAGLAACAALAACRAVAAEGEPSTEQGSAAEVSETQFNERVRPFLAKYCTT